VSKGRLAFLPTYLATTAGSISGFMILFFAGRRWGRAWLERRSRLFSGHLAGRVETLFKRHGYWLVAANRFLPSLRTVVAFIAGTLDMSPARVAVLGFVSCMAWNALLIGLGIWAGSNWQTILGHIQMSLWILVIGIVGWIWIRVWKKRRRFAGPV
jgi:membrane-associated protein